MAIINIEYDNNFKAKQKYGASIVQYSKNVDTIRIKFDFEFKSSTPAVFLYAERNDRRVNEVFSTQVLCNVSTGQYEYVLGSSDGDEKSSWFSAVPGPLKVSIRIVDGEAQYSTDIYSIFVMMSNNSSTEEVTFGVDQFNNLLNFIQNAADLKLNKELYDFKNLGQFATEKEFASACETDYYSSSRESKNFAYKGYIVDSANNQYTAFGLVGHRGNVGLTFDSIVITQKGITCYQYGSEVPIVIKKVASTEASITTVGVYNLKVQGTTEVPNPNSPKSAINQEYLQENYYNKEETSEIINEKYESLKRLIDAIVEDAPEMYDTLKEIADYIESDKSGASEMLSSINQNKEEIKEIKDTYAPKGYVDKRKNPLTKVTYDELVALRDNSQLVPGMQYQITDYETIYQGEGYMLNSAGHRFDIIVTADTENSLNENARATLHEGDTYFYREVHSKTLKTGEVLYMYVDEGTEGYDSKPNDIFVEANYKENNEGVVVPVIYKNDKDYIVGGEEGPDYADTFYFVDKYEYDGNIYDRWRKIENNGVESDDYFGWDDEGQVYALTNELVDASTMKFKDDIYDIKNETKKVNIESWELKYSLDNDRTRFPYASKEKAIYLKGEELWFWYDGIFIHNGEVWHKWVNKEVYENGFYITSSDNPTLQESVHFAYKNEENQEMTNFDMDIVELISPKGKGYIYYMKDEWNNEFNYDFKNALHSFDFYSADGEIIKEVRNMYTFCLEYDEIKDISVEQTFISGWDCRNVCIISENEFINCNVLNLIGSYGTLENILIESSQNVYIESDTWICEDLKIEKCGDIFIKDCVNAKVHNCYMVEIINKIEHYYAVFEGCQLKNINLQKANTFMKNTGTITIQPFVNYTNLNQDTRIGCMIPVIYNRENASHGFVSCWYNETTKSWDMSMGV